MTRFITIVSANPGTGKTTLALNLGLALHQLNRKVVVFDADFSKPNMITHLNIDYLPITLNDVFSGEKHIFDAMYTHTSGLKIIPSLTMQEYDKISTHLQDLLASYEYVIIDMPSGREEIMQVFNQLEGGDPQAIIIHTPQHSSKYVLDIAQILKKQRVLNLGIVLNQSHEQSVNSLYEMPVIAKIPTSAHIRAAAIRKHPVLHTHPHCPSSQSFKTLGRKLTA